MNLDFQIFSDFDGTITKTDSLEFILNKYAGPGWIDIEDRVTRHEINEKDALQLQFNMLDLSLQEALHDLHEIELDPYFREFIHLCRNNSLPVTVLSGGLDIFIEKIFEANGIFGISYHANSVEVENGRWKIIPSRSPKLKNRCNHCKTFWLEKARSSGSRVIYIGDGNTDRCAAQNADIRFAKGVLANYLSTINVAFYEYQSFSEIIKIFTDEILKESEKEKYFAGFEHPLAD